MKCPHCGNPISVNLLARGMGQVGGRKTSAAKKRSSRLNGQKGGRPTVGKGEKRFKFIPYVGFTEQ